MKVKHLFLILVLLFLVSPCFGENWYKFGVDTNIYKGLKIGCFEEFRVDNSLYSYSTDLGISNSFSNIDLGIYFRDIHEETASGKKGTEKRTYFDLKVKGNLFNIDIEDRSRFEYRDLSTREDFWRYRNRIKIQTPKIIFSDFTLRPYISEEIFMDFEVGKISKNRFSVGTWVGLYKNVDVDFFYLHQSNMPGGVDVFGISSMIHF